MCSVRIVSDSGCDLPPELISRFDITVVPLYVRFGQETVLDSEVPVEEFWRRTESLRTAPGTAAPPPGHFQQVFQRLVAAGHEVICLTLPSKQSAVFNSAWTGAQEFGERVRIVDSRSISLGQGVQVLAAAKDALAGCSADAIQRTIESLRDRTSVIFALDTLEWVRRGGRLDRMMPLIEKLARTFSVKPIVELIDGDMHLLGVARSTRSALARLEEEVRARLPLETVAAAYTRSHEAATDLAGRLAAIMNTAPGDVLVREAGPIFATHAGPRALGAVVVRAKR